MAVFCDCFNRTLRQKFFADSYRSSFHPTQHDWDRFFVSFFIIHLVWIIKFLKHKKGKRFSKNKLSMSLLFSFLFCQLLIGFLNWNTVVDLRIGQITSSLGIVKIKELPLPYSEDGVCINTINRAGNRFIVNDEVFLIRVLPLPVDSSVITELKRFLCP